MTTNRVWIMHPIRRAEERLRYQETHDGIPIPVRIFMGCARSSAVALAVIAASAIRLLSEPLAQVVVLVTMLFAFVSQDAQFDVFLPLGFALFRWLIYQPADRPARPSTVRSRSPPRRAILPEKRGGGLMRGPVHGIRARVQGERTRVDGQHEPRDRRLARRTTLRLPTEGAFQHLR